MEKEQRQFLAKHICYTELVFQRINKKLKTNYSKNEIKILIKKAVLEADKIIHKGKNFYAYNNPLSIRVTINSYNYRVITADSLPIK